MSRKIDTSTQPSLVLRLRDHSDATSWQEFVDVYSPLIYEYCRSREIQSSDAADITQEVLLRTAKAIRSFEYDQTKGLFRDWLARIVLNEIRRFTKKPTRLMVSSEDLDLDLADSSVGWNEHFQHYIFLKALERARVHFSDETWVLFERSWIEKIPAEQVAKSLAVGVERVYVARSRVLKQLRFEVAILADDIV